MPHIRANQDVARLGFSGSVMRRVAANGGDFRGQWSSGGCCGEADWPLEREWGRMDQIWVVLLVFVLAVEPGYVYLR